MVLDLRGLNPAPVTPFTVDGDVDFAAIQRLGSWLGSIDGVKSLVVLGHAGEGTFLTEKEQQDVIRAFRDSVDDQLPIIAGITKEGNLTAALEAKDAAEAGAKGALVYPSHGWLRFGFQPGAPQTRYRAIWEESGLEEILFQYPDNTKASYDLDTQLEIAGQEGVNHTKNGVRNMRRWYTEIPALRAAYPDLQVLSCHDEYLLPTMFDVDGLLVGYGNIAPDRVRQHRPRAAGRPHRGRQGEGLRGRPRDPRAAAADHEGGVPPRLAHGGDRRPQVGPGQPRHPGSRHGPRAPASAPGGR